MNPILLRATRIPRAPIRSRIYSPSSSVALRYAHSSYGGEEQSGHQKSSEPNEAVEHEHPGPPAPDISSSKSGSSSSSGGASEQGDKNPPASSGEGSGSKTKNNARPAIHEPGPAPEESEDAKKHNEEMSQRYEKTGNRIGGDGKVEKSFWKGEDH